MEGPPSDKTLLVGVAERDIGAFRALYERHAGWRSGSRGGNRPHYRAGHPMTLAVHPPAWQQCYHSLGPPVTSSVGEPPSTTHRQ